MPLQRIQIPSPNYSSSRARSRLLVLHTSEGATTFRSLGNFLAQASSQVSYHVGFDNTSSAQIGEYVQPPRKSWSAHSANNEGEHGCFCTPSGAANGWSRNDWLARPLMLDAASAWLREESARYGIPLVHISPAQIAAGSAGVCDHHDCVEAGLGGNHTDCGLQLPWDVVLAGGTSGGGSEEDMPLNEHDLDQISAIVREQVLDIVRKEGISGAANYAKVLDPDEAKSIQQIFVEVLRKEGVSGAADK